MPQVVELDATIVTVIQSSTQQTLNHAGKTLDDRIDFVGRNAPRNLLGVATRTLNYSGRLQCKFPGRLILDAALAAL
jgi:hypothetical protein